MRNLKKPNKKQNLGKMYDEQPNVLKARGKPFEYVLFPSLGHNTNKIEPLDIAIHWIKQKALRR